MRNINRTHTAPVDVPRSRRNHMVATLTSLPAGKCVPIAAIPMLREDALNGSITVNVEMLETAELLMNAVNLRVTAYVVPFLAFDRFQGSRDQFDRSYMGEPQVDGGSVIPFFETEAAGTHGANAVYKALGLHAPSAQLVNTAYLEAYNQIWNFRAKNRSKELTPRARLLATLAPAFWQHSRFEHIVPDFDQAVIDGEIALNVVTGSLPLTGSGTVSASGNLELQNAAGAKYGKVYASDITSNNASLRVDELHGATDWTASEALRYRSGLQVALTGVTAELSASGVSISLSNLELAKKTQAWAKIREQYEGIDEEHIIDMLMSGLSIPDQALKQPILLADQTVQFSQAKRYATDATNLAESAVSGGASVSLRLRVPKLNTGGIVMVVAECVPEQLFERQADPLFYADTVADLPEFLRDYLDPEKVETVLNLEIDTAHGTPAGTFGYRPLNGAWTTFGPRVGGKFYRPTTDGATDVERQRLWAVENVNPVLSSDFYLVNAIHTKPFLDTAADPFECTAVGNAVIEGNTVFGGMLLEATANYDAVLAKAPQERIVK